MKVIICMFRLPRVNNHDYELKDGKNARRIRWFEATKTSSEHFSPRLLLLCRQWLSVKFNIIQTPVFISSCTVFVCSWTHLKNSSYTSIFVAIKQLLRVGSAQTTRISWIIETIVLRQSNEYFTEKYTMKKNRIFLKKLTTFFLYFF